MNTGRHGRALNHPVLCRYSVGPTWQWEKRRGCLARSPYKKTHSVCLYQHQRLLRPSVFAGTTKMMRRYTTMQGYAMATHARAESNSLLFGRTVVTIDYNDYHFELRPVP